jgi:hypothetical protein
VDRALAGTVAVATVALAVAMVALAVAIAVAVTDRLSVDVAMLATAALVALPAPVVAPGSALSAVVAAVSVSAANDGRTAAPSRVADGSRGHKADNGEHHQQPSCADQLVAHNRPVPGRIRLPTSERSRRLTFSAYIDIRLMRVERAVAVAQRTS